MLLYLVQHADAVSEEENQSRPLSGAGMKDINKVALYLSKLNVRVNQILFSRKLRARQTAEVIAKALPDNSYRELAESDGLLPLDGPSAWSDRLNYLTDDLMLVGHMPHLGKLAGLLLCDEADKKVISFKTACVVCLERDDKAAWSLRWMITPGIII